MVVIRNSSVSPDILPALPGEIDITALVEAHEGIGADQMIVNATIITAGFIFAGAGPTVLLQATALSGTVFHVSARLPVIVSDATPHPFFEVMVKAQRLSGGTVVDESSPRFDSVRVP